MSGRSYVRTEMMPEKAPPATQRGVIKWMRENLFASWSDSIMTLVALWVAYSVLAFILPWMFHSAWSTNSLSECRDTIHAAYGDNATGACWAVIRERWHQLLFGFYPQDLYWRPVLAFVLMLVALAPILFENVSRKLLWFSAVYPFLAFWLFWGGSIWLPMSIILGFVIGYLALVYLGDLIGSLGAVLASILLPIIWWLYFSDRFAAAVHNVIPLGSQFVESSKFGGFMLSVVIGVTGIVLSLPLGIFLALGRQSNLFIVKTLSVGFIEVVRGVPLITLLFVASTLLNYFLPPGTNFDLVLRVIIMVTLFSSAYMAEVVRGGLAALPRGQYEAADALGLDYWKAMRLIIMPQALKISIPSIVGIFIGLFKDTTLVSIIGLMDPLGLSSAIRANAAWNGIIWELYGFIAFMFFVFCFSMGRYSMYLEKKLQTGHR